VLLLINMLPSGPRGNKTKEVHCDLLAGPAFKQYLMPDESKHNLAKRT
jgi:hypothetical protein